jgi:hypothetical protein
VNYGVAIITRSVVITLGADAFCHPLEKTAAGK